MPTQLAAVRSSLAWLSDQLAPMADRLVEWADHNTGSRNVGGLANFADVLERDFASLDVPCTRLRLPEIHEISDRGEALAWQTGPALMWQHHPQAKRRVLLVIHCDTVYPADSSFAACRRLDEYRLQGPGVADAKGGLAVMLWALRALHQFQLDETLGWTAVVNPDEEIGSPASSQLLYELAPQFDMGLVFEPTLPDGSLVGARRGSGNFTIVCHGRAAHVGRDPTGGRNSLVHLARMADELDRLSRPDEGITVNVGSFHGGGPLNRVPDLAVLRLNVRVADVHQQQEFVGRLSQIVERYNAAEGLRCSLSGAFHAPPKVMDRPAHRLQERFSECCETIGRTIQWKPTGGACDGSKLAAAGLPNIDTLGPTGDFLHSPSEYVDLRTLVPAAQSVAVFLARYAAGEFSDLHRSSRRES